MSGKDSVFLRGMRDGVPIGLGYLAVAFSLGIAAAGVGLTAVQGLVMSLLNNASAGEYAGIAAIRAAAPYGELALLILITNARYLLMSTALSQKLAPDLSIFHRLAIGFDVTDELFGLGIAYPGYLEPKYMYGAMSVSIPGWAVGTALGIVAGNVLPPMAVQALSAAIYGMFIAIVVPKGREDKRVLAVVLTSFALSWIFSALPMTAHLTESVRIIILTVIIAGAAALLMPVEDEEEAAV